jgi:hypothetical protein
MERAGSRLLPHSVSMMLCDSIALKGCATRPGEPASALDRDAVAKQVAVIPLWQMGIGSTIPIEPTALM